MCQKRNSKSMGFRGFFGKQDLGGCCEKKAIFERVLFTTAFLRGLQNGQEVVPDFSAQKVLYIETPMATIVLVKAMLEEGPLKRGSGSPITVFFFF